ncbi:ATP-binding cassette domain-containing protein [Micromonospora endophytica]|uniref:Daunorubicin/doxorubicin resistance ABC transporter ATP-binding protein DrrA n=1 Tax=Micromonospora endophytica TaxID=515350 RepID=A0A2W2D0J0_9ACTN|nr:ATP-binding cassette domain-containing protein [Micromonospora endophytica]PZF97288.1 daunorubicin/doxorubicin resistance ABC transporter ATP-binding protein DrrA [Micromonospora endophytica]RIW43359.1 ATP-binding cassette domain-containing protein [Micromonospora endophytica]BCJ58777.1 daunorubicin resistance protein DrrA family ABC transporter ATP-binding protein [Micromonospora endophytica]
MTDHGLETYALTKRFGRTTALAGVDLALPRGQVLGLLGPNGAGKTTVIRILATLLRPDTGTARVAGYDVVRQPAEVRRRIALSGQHTSVDEELDGRANLIMIGQLLDLTRRDAAHRADDLLARFGLTEVGGRRVAAYSGGMRRRLDLAASLVGRPQVVFLDEPSVGLDPGKREELWQLIRDLGADGVTVLLTTQYLEEADALADLITVIDQGKVVAAGTPAELKHQVGGHTVTVRVTDPADADRVAALLAAVTGRSPERATRQQLAVPVNQDDDFFQITAQLRDQDVDVSELSLRLPSLDEVFRALTRPATVAPTPQRP